ncbi:MAG TPA: right-handed parallel beta-helix repeat-containing protein [Verrucomicrobiae bacterium]|nr:right-handed parallel beta-helix repeat-containing protein [Verrucomicrobiae bacterium]
MIIASSESQPAVVYAGRNTGISVENAGGISIENLSVVGAGMTNNAGVGVLCDNTLTNGPMLEHLNLQNVEVRGFGKQGILIDGGPAGFRHVRVSHCVVHDNLFGGIEIAGRLSWSQPGCSHADVAVAECLAYDNPGDPLCHTRHSGSGIMLLQVDRGLIEHSAAWNNGYANGSHTGGPVGIWTCASKRVTIQRCESFRNRTTAADGGGFDIDGGCENCILQDNYSHDNDGPGLMVYTYPYESRPHRGNVVRFNVSENDSRRSRGYAGLWVRNDNDGIQDLEIYNNTVVAGAWTDQAASIYGEGLAACLRNNIFFARGGAVPLRVEKAQGTLRFENNLYWREKAPVQVLWDEKIYNSLEDWRIATGAESLGGKAVGLFAESKLALHGKEAFSRRNESLRKLPTFRLSPESPAKNGGLNLRERFGPAFASQDFNGTELSASGPWPFGAFADD